MRLVIVLAVLFCLSCSQAVVGQEYWSARFNQTTTATDIGYNTGIFRFNWVTRKYSITFDRPWSETYVFDTSRGYSPVTDETLSTRTTVGACTPDCSVSLVEQPMPPLAVTLTSYHTNVGGAGCIRYTPNRATVVQYFTANQASGVICSIQFVDGRLFTLGSFSKSAPTITERTDCVCDEQIDIFILVDHSGSINDPKMAQFKAFTQNFLNNLHITPEAINVGMAWFHWTTGSNFQMTGDRATVTAALNNWWTNCSLPDTVSYCNSNPLVPGCVGCQKSGTATSTAIQGYTGPTNSRNFPTGQMSVVGARDYFYNPAFGGSVRKVPKMFITLTDGAVNSYLDQRDGIAGCTFATCSPDLVKAVASLRERHNSLFSSFSLTTVAMGIGAPGTDPNLSLSPDHLAILAEQNPANWFTSPDFNTLSAKLRELLLRSCPAAADLVFNACVDTCCGLCICGKCQAPDRCLDNNQCWDPILSGCCNKNTLNPKTSCPTSNKCTQPTCNADQLIAGSNPPRYGTCTFTPTDCSSFVDGCARFNCSASDGTCTTRDTSQCPPVNCVWGQWSIFTSCSATCGTGTQTSTRTITTQASLVPPGAPCVGPTTQTRNCTGASPCCPTPCVYSGWTQWLPPCVNCAGIIQTRNRTLTAASTCGGAPCTAALGQENRCGCSNTSCVGANQTLSACNCTLKTKSLVYRVTVAKVGFGVDCPHLDGTTFPGVPCTTTEINNCPVDCLESWSAWTACDCFYFTQSRNHTVTRIPLRGGKDCVSGRTNYTVSQTCTPTVQQNCPLYGRECTQNSDCTDQFPCTQDLCLLKPDGKKHCDWSTPTYCPVNLCYSNNTCDNSVVPGGCRRVLKSNASACPPPNKCFLPGCDPAANSGTGKCIQTPIVCNQPASPGPDACQVNKCTNATGLCTTYDRSACPPVNCVWGLWSDWTGCNKVCGNGTQTSTRTNTPAKDGGIACTGPSSQTRSCNVECCIVNCAATAWTAWSTCNCSNSSATRTRTASVTRLGTCTGAACTPPPSCNFTNCTSVLNPVSVGATCTGTAVGSVCTWRETCPPCGARNCTGANSTGPCFCAADGLTATTKVTYSVSVSAVAPGIDCPHADQTSWNISCTPQQVANCPLPCIEAWTPWSNCSCYNSTQNRTYTVFQKEARGGTPCQFTKNFSEYRTCTPISTCTDIGFFCDVDADCNDEIACTIDKCRPNTADNGVPHCNWAGVPNCTSNNFCLTGFCDNTVGCTTDPITPSIICKPANLCLVPSCNPALNSGLGACVFTPVNCSGYTGVNGEACVKLDCDITNGKCSIPNRTLCPPIPCTYGEWEAWSACPVSCGNSTQTRIRYSNQTAKDNGAECDPLLANETQNCSVNGGCCPTDCVLTQWSKWSAAQCVNCVPGNQTRNRTVSVPESCGGTCQALNDTSLTCPACVPVDCVESNTTTPCNCTGNGTYGDWTITYHIDVQPVGPGKPCSFPDKTTWFLPCDKSAVALCPTPCEEVWSNFSKCDCQLLTQTQNYTILKNPTNGGRPCTYPRSRNLTQKCTPTNDQNCYGPSCKTAADCDDKLACTLDRCLFITPPGSSHCDWSQNVTCSDNSLCTDVHCDQLLGCVYDQVLFCDDLNNCTIDSCDDVKGCQHAAVRCPDFDICNLGFCNPTTGCGFTKRNCTGNLSIVDNCTVAFCDVNYTQNKLDNPCQAIPLCGQRFNFALGLAGGIIALIVVLAILAAAMVSGGAAAAAAVASQDEETKTSINPLYFGNSASGVNATHQ